MAIRMLNEATINQIAAGEVIIRPVSVVKELVENAIDAGADQIRVSIMDGGTKRIVISDNGCGIPWNEVQLAFERHATSKLRNIEDLQSIETLGFRGEALSSIIAVSRLTVTTRYVDEEIGSQTVFEGGQCLNQRVCGHDRGTVMDVSDLFYNMPARQKHMSKIKTEGALIRDMMEKLALSHPDIAFTFESDCKKQFATLGRGDLKEAIEGVFGRGFVQGLIPLNVENSPMNLTGYMGGINASRATKDLQIFFVNGRYIKNQLFAKAFEEAYEGYLMQHRHPVGIVFITLPGRMLDVNIHPTKTEVGILNQSLVSILFKQGIREALKKQDLSIDLSKKDGEEKDSFLLNSDSLIDDNKKVTDVSFLDSERSNRPMEKSEQENESKTPSVEKNILPDPLAEHQLNVFSGTVAEPVSPYGDREKIQRGQEKHMAFSKEPKVDLSGAKIVGQLFATYILLEQGNEAFLIDQHAAHEAFMYEELRERFETRSAFPSQTLLVPQPVQVPLRLINEFEDHKEALLHEGFDCDIFGEDTLMVRSVPVILGEPQPITLIEAWIDHHLYGADEERSVQIQRIITMSCKAAVKGNQVLSYEEIKTLINGLMALDNPFTCPHGRPIIFRARAYDFEKLFKRVI